MSPALIEGMWERSLYRGLVGKLVVAEQVGTQRRRKEDLGRGRVAGSYEKGYERL
jgi:hypothetical protein